MVKSFSVRTLVTGGLLVVILLCAAHWYGQRTGFVKGVDFLFNQCYNIGGVVVDERGAAVVCAPLGPIPKDELPPLDKKQDMWYDRNKNNVI